VNLFDTRPRGPTPMNFVIPELQMFSALYLSQNSALILMNRRLSFSKEVLWGSKFPIHQRFQLQQDLLHPPRSTTIAPTNPGAGSRESIAHRAPSAACSSAARPGVRDTVKLSSGRLRPAPCALTYASLRVQQRKNASGREFGGRACSSATSLDAKYLRATSSLASCGRICSTSTPSSRPRENA